MQITWEEFKAKRDILANEYRAACEVLNAIPGRASGPFGITPDSVKNSPAWRAAYTAERKAFAAMREYNGLYVAKFKKEILAEIQAKREAKCK